MPPGVVEMDAAFAKLTPIRDRTPTSSGPAFAAAFDTLASTETGGVFAAAFQGTSAWERHPNGDELVQIVKGQAFVSVITDGEVSVFDMKAPSFVIVPRGAWHRFEASEGVEVMTMTPQPTEHWREGGLPPND